MFLQKVISIMQLRRQNASFFLLSELFCERSTYSVMQVPADTAPIPIRTQIIWRKKKLIVAQQEEGGKKQKQRWGTDFQFIWGCIGRGSLRIITFVPALIAGHQSPTLASQRAINTWTSSICTRAGSPLHRGPLWAIVYYQQ